MHSQYSSIAQQYRQWPAQLLDGGTPLPGGELTEQDPRLESQCRQMWFKNISWPRWIPKFRQTIVVDSRSVVTPVSAVNAINSTAIEARNVDRPLIEGNRQESLWRETKCRAVKREKNYHAYNSIPRLPSDAI